MLLLGLLLIAATAAFTGLAIADNLSGGPVYHVTVLGHTIATMNSLEIFLSGLALALIFCLGLAMMRTGGVLAKRRRLRMREAPHVRREGLVGDAVPTTPNGANGANGAATPVRQPAATQPGQPAGTVDTGAEPTTGTVTTAAPAPDPTPTAPQASDPAPAATPTSGRPRRHIHLFGH